MEKLLGNLAASLVNFGGVGVCMSLSNRQTKSKCVLGSFPLREEVGNWSSPNAVGCSYAARMS